MKFSEPHVCTGHFTNDFTELCQRNNMVVIPSIVHRPRRPPSPSERPPPDTKEQKKGDKNKQAAPVPEPEPEIELDENGGKRLFMCWTVLLWFLIGVTSLMAYFGEIDTCINKLTYCMWKRQKLG
jgi:hypothetical protein